MKKNLIAIIALTAALAASTSAFAAHTTDEVTEMETALKTQELTPELLAEAKRIEFPDNVIAQKTGIHHRSQAVPMRYRRLRLLLKLKH